MNKKLKLLKKDVLIKPVDINKVSNSIIHIYSESERKEKINHFEVIDVSEQVTLVSPGDIVLVEYMQHTFPFDWNEQRCAITSEDDIVAVLEK